MGFFRKIGLFVTTTKSNFNDRFVKACKAGNYQDFRYLLDLINDPNGAFLEYGLHCGSFYGHIDIVKYCISRRAGIHSDDDAALRHACQEGHLEIVEYLVERGANIRAKNDFSLRITCQKGHLNCLKYLASRIETKEGQLHPLKDDKYLTIAMSRGYEDIVEYLKEYK